MQIPIWRCDKCGDPVCILIRVDCDPDVPDTCPWSGELHKFIPSYISDNELFEYLKKYATLEA